MKNKKDDKNYKRLHPFTVYENLSRFMWILIIPLLRTVMSKQKSLSKIIADSKTDILLTAILVLCVFFAYRGSFYSYKNNRLAIKRQLVFKKTHKILLKNSTFAVAEQSFLQKIFGAVKISVVTSSKGADSTFCIPYKGLKKFLSVICKNSALKEKPDLINIIITCIFQSDVLTFLPVAALFLKRAGKLFGEEYERFLLSSIDLSRYIYFLKIPPFFGILAGFLIIAFISAACVKIFRLSSLSVWLGEKMTAVKSGIFKSHFFISKKESIYFVSVRQSAVLTLLDLAAVYIELPFNKAEKSVMIMPAYRLGKSLRTATSISCFEKPNLSIKPKKAVFGFVALPLALFFSAAVLKSILSRSGFDGFSGTAVAFLLGCLSAFCLFWLLFRVFAYKKAVLSISERTAEICFYKRLHIRYDFVKKEYIELAKIRQNPVQRLFGRCSLYVYTYKNRTLKIKQLYKRDALKAVEKLFNNSD